MSNPENAMKLQSSIAKSSDKSLTCGYESVDCNELQDGDLIEIERGNGPEYGYFCLAVPHGNSFIDTVVKEYKEITGTACQKADGSFGYYSDINSVEIKHGEYDSKLDFPERFIMIAKPCMFFHDDNDEMDSEFWTWGLEATISCSAVAEITNVFRPKKEPDNNATSDTSACESEVAENKTVLSLLEINKVDENIGVFAQRYNIDISRIGKGDVKAAILYVDAGAECEIHGLIVLNIDTGIDYQTNEKCVAICGCVFCGIQCGMAPLVKNCIDSVREEIVQWLTKLTIQVAVEHAPLLGYTNDVNILDVRMNTDKEGMLKAFELMNKSHLNNTLSALGFQNKLST